MKTKDRILIEALQLFSKNGYDAVSMEQIAKAVGIKAPSLYKHYRGKQELFDAILQETERRYREFVDEIVIQDGEMDQINVDEIVQKAQAYVSYAIHDPYVSAFRRLLTVEQFKNSRLTQLYSDSQLNLIMEYHAQLFSELMDVGKMRRMDPAIAAEMYDAPISIFIGEIDRHPKKEEEILKRVEKHVRMFYQLMEGDRK